MLRTPSPPSSPSLVFLQSLSEGTHVCLVFRDTELAFDGAVRILLSARRSFPGMIHIR